MFLQTVQNSFCCLSHVPRLICVPERRMNGSTEYTTSHLSSKQNVVNFSPNLRYLTDTNIITLKNMKKIYPNIRYKIQYDMRLTESEHSFLF